MVIRNKSLETSSILITSLNGCRKIADKGHGACGMGGCITWPEKIVGIKLLGEVGRISARLDADQDPCEETFDDVVGWGKTKADSQP